MENLIVNRIRPALMSIVTLDLFLLGWTGEAAVPVAFFSVVPG